MDYNLGTAEVQHFALPWSASERAIHEEEGALLQNGVRNFSVDENKCCVEDWVAVNCMWKDIRSY